MSIESFLNMIANNGDNSRVGGSAGSGPVITKKMALIGAGLILALFLQPFATVQTGFRGVITQYGEIKQIRNEGLVLLWPWEKLTSFNIRAETADITKADGSTSDTQPVFVGLTVRYSINPDKVAQVFEKYSRDGDLSSYVQTATMEAFKSVSARYPAPHLIAKRTQVSQDVWTALQKKLDIYGATVVNIDMTQFSFNNDYMAAINDKVTQEQKRLAAENKVRTVEAEMKQNVAIAEGQAAARKAQADGEAYSQLKLAQAQADALRIQNDALAKNKDVLELRRIEVELKKAEKWDGKLPENLYASAPMPFLSLPASH